MGEKRGDLKLLVQSNFNAFVGAKNTVDELQQEMRSNSITEETEYSTQAYEKTLMDAIEQANIVFGPIMERTSRSEKIRTTLNIVERYKFFFNLPSSMLEYIKNSKYDLAVRDYKKGRHLMKSAASGTGSEGALRSLFDKVWVAVQISVGKVHESIFSKLDNPWAEIDIQTKHISYLLQLDSPNDPVVYFLQNQHKWVIEFVDRSFSEYVETLLGEAPAEEFGTEQSLLKRAKVLDLLQSTDKADSFVAAVEKQAFSGRWRATLTLIKILSEVIGKTIPELFRFIEQFHSNDQYNKKFDSSRTEGVWSQITEEIVALLAIAISKLFHAEPVSLPRRSDKSRHFNVIAALNQKKLPPFPVDVCCYVAGHYAGLMAQELSAAVIEAKAVALSKHARKLLTSVFSTFRTDIISIFCDGWVQDSRALFLSQDPQRAILPNLFQDHQQKCIGILQTLVQTTAAVLPDLRPESDPAILECAIPSLIQSTQAFLDGVNYSILVIHEPAEGKNDHLVAGLSCLQSIKERTRKLLADFETKLALSKRLNLTEIKTSEKVLDGVFFDSLISAKFVSIRETIHYGILYSGFDWETDVTPKEIRPYIYEILMALVVVHAETIKMADHLVKRVLTTLAELIAQEFLICFRKLDQLSKQGALQATLEIEFIEQTLQPFNNFKITNTFKSVYGSVQQGHHAMGHPPFQNIQDKELRDLEKLIAAARHTTRTQFACFTLRG
ncbi:Exocyst complex component S5 [Entomophthora muscae]|uniref:Exocyst complex component S5 n=1 Tax=Entomophthora muscae TaxID=34485 RepID=A0ACC2RJF8_9FUNG|nr:Exocyst complex component S5 [Entomophthora muscae]